MTLSTSWTYHNPVRVVVAQGALSHLPQHATYQRMALVTSPGFRQRGVVAQIEEILEGRVVTVIDDVISNPDLSDVNVQAKRLRPMQPDALIALGGGSSIDTAKALARVLPQHNDVDLAAHFRSNTAFNDVPAVPLIAIPTTSGTGAEVTPFGTIWDFKTRRKYSVAGDDLYPRLALLDPQLTVQLPEAVTISTGLDAISHAMESTWNRNATPISIGFALESLRLSLRALPKVKDQPDDRNARSDMMVASLLAGLAIAQTRTALAHSMSYPLTTEFNLPHGLACSFTLPALLEFNAEADDGRLAQLASALGFASTQALSDELRSLFRYLDLGKRITSYAANRRSIIELSPRMFTPGRAANNLRDASADDILSILDHSLAALDIA